MKLPECTERAFNTEADWLDGRKGFATASMAPGLFAEHADVYGSPYQIYAALRGEAEPREPTIPMRLGHAAEPLIAELAEEATGVGLVDPGDYTLQVNTSDCRMACTLDRVTDEAEPRIVEMKNVGAYMVDGWKLGWCYQIPAAVQIQMQHQFMVTGVEGGFAAALLGGVDFVALPTARNDDFINYNLRPRWLEMFERVQLGEPPEPLACDLGAVKHLFRDVKPELMIDLPERAVEVAEAWAEAKAVIKAAEAERKTAEAALRTMIGDAEVGRFPDGSGLGLSLKRQTRRAGRILRARKGLK